MKGQRDAEAIREEMRALIGAEDHARTDYVSIADPETRPTSLRLELATY